MPLCGVLLSHASYNCFWCETGGYKWDMRTAFHQYEFACVPGDYWAYGILSRTLGIYVSQRAVGQQLAGGAAVMFLLQKRPLAERVLAFPTVWLSLPSEMGFQMPTEWHI